MFRGPQPGWLGAPTTRIDGEVLGGGATTPARARARNRAPNFWGRTLAPCALDLRPGVPQRDGALEERASGARVARIEAEVAVALELEALLRARRAQAGLQLAAREHAHRVWIEVREEVRALGALLGLGHA